MSYCSVRVAILVLFTLLVTACGNTEIRGQARDASVSAACFEAGFAPCNSLVVAVQEHRRGNLPGALTSLNVWLSQIGMERDHLTTRSDAFEPIARRSVDASRLFGDAVRNPGVGQHIDQCVWFVSRGPVADELHAVFHEKIIRVISETCVQVGQLAIRCRINPLFEVVRTFGLVTNFRFMIVCMNSCF